MVSTVQIELAGYCSAECEFCDWVRRPKEQMILMDTQLAKKIVQEAIDMKAGQISFHITGESLLHPDLLDIVPMHYPTLISTNCLSLEGDLAKNLSQRNNLLMILAVLWCESESKRTQSIQNALEYLKFNPVNKSVFLQMVCSENSVHWARYMYDTFSPFLKLIPNLFLFYKQPYTQEFDRPTLGYMPKNIPEGPSVIIEHMPTPQSCGPDCLAKPPNPSTDILVQSDGQIKPCFKRWSGWGLGYAQTTTLQEALESKRFAEIKSIWEKGDPDNKLACHDCIRMAVPRGEGVWWGPGGTNIPTFVYKL